MWHYPMISKSVLAVMLLAGTVLAAPHASAQIALPSGNAPFLSLFGDGVQIYDSVEDVNHPGTFVWKLTAPQANLFTDSAETTLVATHFGGPTWMSVADGSAVTGAVIGMASSSHPDSILQLLLRANSHTGAGLFDDVSYIQRLDTVGGLAPSLLPTGLGQEFRSPYTATYRFAEAVPEPGSLTILIGAGVSLVGLALRRRRRSAKSSGGCALDSDTLAC